MGLAGWNSGGRPITITRLEDIVLTVADLPWRFADAHRAEIKRNFAALKSGKQDLYNGGMYMLREHRQSDGVFSGVVSRSDFASFLYWREHPEATFSDARNCFGIGALHSADGAVICGIMGDHTANAGLIYCPCGSIDDDDIIGDRVDIGGNIARELAEETGLDIGPGPLGPWLAVDDGLRIALICRIDLAEPAAALVQAIEAHLAGQKEPELSGVHVLRGRDDRVPERMPAHMLAYIDHVFAE